MEYFHARRGGHFRDIGEIYPIYLAKGGTWKKIQTLEKFYWRRNLEGGKPKALKFLPFRIGGEGIGWKGLGQIIPFWNYY